MPRLRKVHPDQPGWSRRRAGRGFTYLDESGERLSSEQVERIKALAIPPAWVDVWICPLPQGHLQATGTDEAGRRQYLYHPQWRARRDRDKFARVEQATLALPRVRRRVTHDLALDGMPLRRACAAAVRLLDLGCFRIGNDVYADAHGSFGLTTLRREHVRRHGGQLVFRFTGKSGVEHVIEVDDPDVADALAVMRRSRGPSHQLLVHRDEKGAWHELSSSDVNEYLADLFEVPFTAKDFRTWHATVLAAEALALSDEPGDSQASRRRAVRGAMQQVADYLGNTPAMARSSYVDPRVVDAYERGRTIETGARRGQRSPRTGRAGVENAVHQLLK